MGWAKSRAPEYTGPRVPGKKMLKIIFRYLGVVIV